MPSRLRWNFTLVTKLNDLFCDCEHAFYKSLAVSLVTCTGNDIGVLTGFGGIGINLRAKLVRLDISFFDEKVLNADEDLHSDWSADLMRFWMNIAACHNLTQLQVKGFDFRSIPFVTGGTDSVFLTMQLGLVFDSISQLTRLCIGNGECDDFDVYSNVDLEPSDLVIILEFLPHLEVLELHMFGENLDDNLNDQLLQNAMDVGSFDFAHKSQINILQDFVPNLTAFNNCGHVGSPILASMFPKLKHVQLAFGERPDDDFDDSIDVDYFTPAHDFMRTFDTINEFIEQKKALLTTQPTGSVEVMVIWILQTGMFWEQKLQDCMEDLSPHKDLNMVNLCELAWNLNPHNLNPFEVDAAGYPRFGWALHISTEGVSVYVIGCEYDHLETGPRDTIP